MAEGYDVTNVDKRERFGPAGKRLTYFDVSIRTDRGSTGSVQIEEKDFTTEKVRELLDALYEKLELAFAL